TDPHGGSGAGLYGLNKGSQQLMRKPSPSPSEPSIIRSTLRKLLHPRRLVPIVLLASSLGVAQANDSSDPFAIPLGIAMCVAFVIAAPLSWRVLFPDRFNL